MPYQPLTEEQFNKARASGFTTEQIVEFEKKRKQEQQPMFKSEAEGRIALSKQLQEQKKLEQQATPLSIAKKGLGNTALAYLNPLAGNIPEIIAKRMGRTFVPPEVTPMERMAGTAAALLTPAGIPNQVARLAGEGITAIRPTINPILKMSLQGAAGTGSVLPLPNEMNTPKQFAQQVGKNMLGGAFLGAVGGAIPKPMSNKELPQHILSTYSRAVNPAIGSIKNITKLDEFQRKTIDAMKAIARNKNLRFENETTGAMEYRLPKSRADLFEALKQTKQSIFDEYNNLQKSATSTGITIDVPSIAYKSFNEINNSRQYKMYAPSMANEAKTIMNRLMKSGKATPQQIQEDIAFLNQQMKGYYQKGEYNAANIYANYAANLRKGLDDAIEKAIGDVGYQDLKNQYSALKSVETDITKAAARQLKSTSKSMSETFSNPIALAEMARGIFTSSPAEFATGLTIKTFANIQKALNNPDWRIANMFKNIQKVK